MLYFGGTHLVVEKKVMFLKINLAFKKEDFLLNVERNFRAQHVLLLSLALVGFMKCSTDEGGDIYEKGVQKLLNESPSESIDFLLESDIKQPRDLYLIAYNYFLEGDIEKSRNITTTILTLNPSEKLEGSCYYLLGMIARSSGNQDLELSFLTKAVDKSQGRNKGLFQTELAYTFLLTKSYEKCADLLDKVLPQLTGNDLTRWHQVKSRYYIRTNQKEKALETCLKMECVSSPRCEGIRQVEIAYCYIRLEEYDEALKVVQNITYSDPYIDSIVEAFKRSLNGLPLENNFPEDKMHTELIEWLQENVKGGLQ